MRNWGFHGNKWRTCFWKRAKLKRNNLFLRSCGEILYGYLLNRFEKWLFLRRMLVGLMQYQFSIKASNSKGSRRHKSFCWRSVNDETLLFDDCLRRKLCDMNAITENSSVKHCAAKPNLNTEFYIVDSKKRNLNENINNVCQPSKLNFWKIPIENCGKWNSKSLLLTHPFGTVDGIWVLVAPLF